MLQIPRRFGCMTVRRLSELAPVYSLPDFLSSTAISQACDTDSTLPSGSANQATFACRSETEMNATGVPEILCVTAGPANKTVCHQARSRT
jgi:hypothetical protein